MERCPLLEGVFRSCPLSVCTSPVQSCVTLCDPVDGSLPGSSVRGIPQARYWRGGHFPSRGSSRPRGGTRVSCFSCAGGRILSHCATREALRPKLDKGFSLILKIISKGSSYEPPFQRSENRGTEIEVTGSRPQAWEMAGLGFEPGFSVTKRPQCFVMITRRPLLI